MYRKGYASRNIRGKLRVCKYLETEDKLKKYVPKTVRFNRANLESMAEKYETLYIKPDVGSHGKGIYKLICGDYGYELKWTSGSKQRSRRYGRLSGVYERIAGKSGRSLIIQQGIALDRLDGRPYDIRAMVQRKPGGRWVCTGFMAKVGKAGKIVTNYFQGGEIYTMRDLCGALGLSGSERRRRIRKLSKTALRIAGALSERRAGMHEMGIDFAYDKDGRLWVLEVNSNHPQFHPLKQIDRRAYERMKSFAESYGRKNAK